MPAKRVIQKKGKISNQLTKQRGIKRPVISELSQHEALMNFDLKPIQIRFLTLFVKNNFHIQKTCEALDLSLMTYSNWKNQSKDFKAAVDICMETELDIFEDALRDLVKERNPQAVMFGLKTRGKSRGYAEKQDVNVGGITAINITFEKANDNDSETTN